MLYPTPIKSEYRGWGGTQASEFFKAPKWFQCAAKAEDHYIGEYNPCPSFLQNQLSGQFPFYISANNVFTAEIWNLKMIDWLYDC